MSSNNKNPFAKLKPFRGGSRAEQKMAAGALTMGARPSGAVGEEPGVRSVTEAKLPLADKSVPSNVQVAGDFVAGSREREDQERIDALLGRHGTSARAVVDFVLQEQRRMAERRMLQEREWALSLAFAEGSQWLGHDDTTRRIVSLMNEEEKDRYVTVNLLDYNVRKLAAICTQSAPDANAAPQTDAPIDRAAGAEARAINAHCDRLFDRALQTQDRVKWALKTTTCFTKVTWDATARALVPQFGPDGSLAGSVSARVGEIDEQVVPGFEVFCDASALKWADVRTVHHVKLRPMSWAQERYGARGRLVKGDQRDVTTGYVDAYLYGSGGSGAGALAAGPAQADSALRWGKEQDSAAYVYERWELPSPRYPKGRYMVVMGGQLLDYREYPYTDREGNPRRELPFVPLAWDSSAGSPYGRSPVRDAIPLQVAYNRAYSATTELLEAPIATAIIEEGSGAGADAFDWLRRVVRKLYYKRGSTPPAVTTYDGSVMDRERFLDITYMRIQDIFGLHDAMNGRVQNGATSGIAINLQQQSDQSHISLFVAQIEASAVKIKEWEIALYEQFAVAPRLLGIADIGDMQQAATNVSALRALTDGGQTRVLVRPGSAMPKSAAGERQEALELFDRGVYGPPGSPGAALLLLRALSLPESDRMYEEIVRWAQADAQQAQAAGPPNPMADAQAKAQAEAALLQPKTDEEIRKYQAMAQVDVAKEAALRELRPALAPITIKGDPAFTLAVEEASGFDPHDAGAHLATLATVNPHHAGVAHGVAGMAGVAGVAGVAGPGSFPHPSPSGDLTPLPPLPARNERPGEGESGDG